MKIEAPLLCMPFLHPDSQPCSLPPEAKHIWPGLPHCPTEGFWLPGSYPFSPEQAKACLEDMCAMSEAALSGVPLQALAAAQARPEALREQEEEDALARFARSGDAPPASGESDMLRLRTAAQKALLWAWLLEERSRELRELRRSYSVEAARLSDVMGVEHDDDAQASLAALDTQLADDAVPHVPWKMVLANAALFLPLGTSLLITNAAMRNDIGELIEFSPIPPTEAAALGLSPDARCQSARAPLWRVLGHTASKPACPWLDATVRIITIEETL